MSPPVLITIKPTEDDFGRREFKTMKLGPFRGRQYGPIGKHQPITCYFNHMFSSKKKFKPCVAIYLDGISRWSQAIHVINHESIHHALQWLSPDPLAPSGSEGDYDGFDNLFADYTKSRRFGF